MKRLFFNYILEKKNASENKDEEVNDNVDVDCEHIEGVEQEVYSSFSFLSILFFSFFFNIDVFFISSF